MYCADLTRDSRFWKVSVVPDNTAIVSYGVIGSKGRSTSRSFVGPSEADAWAKAAAAIKVTAGYAPLVNNAPSKGVTRSSTKNSVEDDGSISRSIGTIPIKAKKAILKRSSTKSAHSGPTPSSIIAGSQSKKSANSSKKTQKKSPKSKGEVASPPATSTGDSPPSTPAPVKPPVDAMFPDCSVAEVVDDFDATLNQSNVLANNNKYYRLQLLRVTKKSHEFFVWTRWGRVGESYSSSTLKLGPFMKLETAIPAFEKKFYSKTGNHWANRSNFVPRMKKYDLLEVDYTKKEDAHLEAYAAADAAGTLGRSKSTKKEKVEYMPSSLDAKTQDLVTMLFEKDLYAHAMQEFDIDTRRMPLGQLTSAQVVRGMDVLDEIEGIIRSGRTWATELDHLSSRFYSVIPHDFGRARPPTINSQDRLQKCFDKCNVLLDIEKATKLMADADKRKKDAEKRQKDAEAKCEKVLLPHPTESMYKLLQADLSLVDRDSDEYAMVLRAFTLTSDSNFPVQLVDVWRVDRHGEEERFSPFRKMNNHKLLWHGTNIAVVAAILSNGLRIMPYSGGRVGAGIYMASESGVSQGYVSRNYKRNIGCMFLAEAALGREFSLVHDDPSLRRAPAEFDSVVARGWQAPSSFEQVVCGGNKVLLPSAKPVRVASYKLSAFSQDEYLVYREEQVRLRYVLTVRFS